MNIKKLTTVIDEKTKEEFFFESEEDARLFIEDYEEPGNLIIL